MKVFISWSGERSLVIAKGLREWLPRVIQAIEPWMSDSDADKGIRWEQRIGLELEQTRFGIFCLTPENLDSRWLNFEAGAIAKTVDKTYVCTYLLELKPTDIEGPLSHFNHTKTEKEDTRRLIHTVNRALESQALDEKIVNDSFELFWPRLEMQFNQLPPVAKKRKPRNIEDMTEEILVSVRALLEDKPGRARPVSLGGMVNGKSLTPRGKRIASEALGKSLEEIDRIYIDRDYLRAVYLEATGRDLGLNKVDNEMENEIPDLLLEGDE
jgi:hypothetical protein